MGVRKMSPMHWGDLIPQKFAAAGAGVGVRRSAVMKFEEPALLIAHNANFDMGVVRRACAIVNMPRGRP